MGTVTTYDAQVLLPQAVTAGPDGNMWAIDGRGAITRMTLDGVVTPFEYPALVAPAGMAPGPDGNVWFTDRATHSIGRITPAGEITIVATGGGITTPEAITAGSDGNLWFTNRGTFAGDQARWVDSGIGRITPDGVVTIFTHPDLDTPVDIVAAPDGDVWFTNQGTRTPDGWTGSSIGRITPSGVITTFVDTRVGLVSSSGGLGGIAVAPDGSLWFANSDGSFLDFPDGVVPNLARITTDGEFSGGGHEFGVDASSSLVFDSDGTLWFTRWDAVTHVGRASADTVFPGSTVGRESLTLGPDGNVWVAPDRPGLVRITPQAEITEFAGTGPAEPTGLVRGPDGNLWFANVFGDSIGSITPTGEVTSFTLPGVKKPRDLAFAPDGTLYFLAGSAPPLFDTRGYRVGRMSLDGELLMLTDLGIVTGRDLVVGPDGNAWFLESRSSTEFGVSRVTPSGAVTYFADERLSFPTDLVAGPQSAVWFRNGETLVRLGPTGELTFIDDPAVGSPRHLTVGPDGDLWFVQVPEALGRVTPAGDVVTVGAPGLGDVSDLVAGPDGNLWAVASGTGSPRVTRITIDGEVTAYPDAPSSGDLAPGADGGVWYGRGWISLGRIQALADSVMFAGRFTDDQCASLDLVAAALGMESRAEVVQAGVELTAAVDAAGLFPPVVAPPIHDGGCEVGVKWPADRTGLLSTTSASLNLSEAHLHTLGGHLVMAIVYALTAGGGG